MSTFLPYGGFQWISEDKLQEFTAEIILGLKNDA
jgi:hypothetical protein